MVKHYLEVTCRQGKPFAAYLYLRRDPGDKTIRTEKHPEFLVDYSTDGRAIGIEFTHIGSIDLTSVNQVLAAAKESLLSSHDLAPLTAA